MTEINPSHVAAVRRFNRFYTQHLGVLHDDGWLDSAFTLTQARVLYELSIRKQTTATEIGRELGLDAGYLSRMLRGFDKAGLVRKASSPNDARQTLLALTARGRKAFAPLEARTDRDVGAMLGRLRSDQRDRLVEALQSAQTLIDNGQQAERSFDLREPRPGDFGWIVSRHGALYAQEYQWTDRFEGLCAQIVADFVNNFDPDRERCWVATLDGENAGSVMLAKDSADVARLRLLLVEPFARGRGIGKRLTEECIGFARQCGYRRVTLWTHSVLTAARHIYAASGFRLTSSERKRSFGQDVVSEHWDLEL